MNTIPSIRLGKNQRALLAFVGAYPGPHSLTSNRRDASHAALDSLSQRGLVVKSTVGASVFAELAQDQNARNAVASLTV